VFDLIGGDVRFKFVPRVLKPRRRDLAYFGSAADDPATAAQRRRGKARSG